jgi:hypothetical protein
VRRSRAAIVALAAVVMTLTSCAGSDSAGVQSSDTEPATSAVSAATDAVSMTSPISPATALAGAGSVLESSTTSSTQPDVHYGSCQIDITGDKTISWTGIVPPDRVYATYWLTDEQKQANGGKFQVGMLCVDPRNVSNSVFVGASGDSDLALFVPYGPGVFPLTPSDVVAHGLTNAFVFNPVVALAGSHAGWSINGNGGTLELTAFDEAHIAGTFNFPALDTGSQRSGLPSEGEIVVTGSFDIPHPAS